MKKYFTKTLLALIALSIFTNFSFATEVAILKISEINFNLKSGSKITEVTKLQTFLKQEGVAPKSFPVTGYYGPLTAKYVKIYKNRKITGTNLMAATSSPIKNILPPVATSTETSSTKKSGCTPADSGFAFEVEKAINNARKNAGVPDVKVCAELRATAKAKYNDIVAQNTFTHTWKNNQKLQDVIRSNGYPAKDWGEILTFSSEFVNGQDYVNEWLSSPAHKAIMLDAKYTDLGIYVGPWKTDDVDVMIGVGEFGKR